MYSQRDMMTDDERLALLDNVEFGAWDKLTQPWRYLRDTVDPLDVIERCQRIRAGLREPIFKVTNVGGYEQIELLHNEG